MKRIILPVVFLSVMAINSFAHGGNDMIIHGYIVDNMCAGTHKSELGVFVKTHGKICMLKESCMKSGYSIFSLDDGKLYAFDKASNEAVVNFLKGADNRVDVVIIAEKNGDALMVEHIANQRVMR